MTVRWTVRPAKGPTRRETSAVEDGWGSTRDVEGAVPYHYYVHIVGAIHESPVVPLVANSQKGYTKKPSPVGFAVLN